MRVNAGECGRKRMGEGRGRGGMRVSEAFRCHGANLLPFPKFIGNGLFIKELGQVDLRGAPLNITHTHTASPPAFSHTLPGFHWLRGVFERRTAFKEVY